ncbi:hypothetical protein LSAT2_020507 [Lamellibrachia satsuma]|nr:hypothetical protein LSAT2_020507 [Lamellibrachia satsuma]
MFPNENISSCHLSFQHERLHENRDREKERQLHRRVGDLTTQVNTLEKRVGLFKHENQSLKRKLEEERTSEEKVKRLKRRNAELASIARRLEEKVKLLQQDSLKKARMQSTEAIKQTFAKQRARLLAEHAKAMLVRDKEIESLQEKCCSLTEQLKAALDAQVLNSEIYEDKVELENIIKLSAKEKLQLERQLVQQPQFEADLKRLQELHQTNQSLEVEIEKLMKTVRHAEKLEVELGKKQVECETLNCTIEDATKEYTQLESVLDCVTEKNVQLTALNSNLQNQLAQLSKVSVM